MNNAKIRQYIDDFNKIQELMSRTMDRYCKDFLEEKEVTNPLSEESKKTYIERLKQCANDEQYKQIVDSYLQSFHQGHLYLKQKLEKKPDVFPLIVKYQDGKYIVGVSNQDNLEGMEISAINGIPIQEYVKNHRFATGDRAFAFDKDGHLYSPEFQINDDTCILTMQDGTEQVIDKIPREQASNIMAQKKGNIKDNVICGKLTDSGTPYICIQSFARDKEGKEYDRQVIKDFAKRLNEEGQTDIVIDIRGNGGGSDEYFEYLGFFADKDYSQKHEYKQLVGLDEQEVNAKISEKKIDDIDSVLERIEHNPNREIRSHDSTIPNGNSSITNRILLVDGKVFSSADKLAKTVQGSGFATVVGTELTAGDGRGISTYSVDTPILRELGVSITMPSTMGLDFNDFQTKPDIIVRQQDLNQNLSQIMGQVKEQKQYLDEKDLSLENENQLSEQTPEVISQKNEVLSEPQQEENVTVEWQESNVAKQEQTNEMNNYIINHVEVSSQALSNPSLEHGNGLGQTGQIGEPTNSVTSMSDSVGRTR